VHDRVLWALAIACAATAHGCKSQRENTGEQEFVEHEVAELKTALVKRDETGVTIGCISATLSQPKMPKALAAEIEQLCYVDAPKLLLENAIADARKQKAGPPELGDLACMQLFAGDAFKAIIAHPHTDAALSALVDEYTRLCPAEVAKFRAR
jgi:hypothetical protein